MAKKLTIGELSRRSGLPVKTIRFYSDEGLLVPSERTRSGYRLYTEEHVIRLEIIRTLRDAGVGLEAIGAVLRRDVKLEQALRLHLGAIEAHIASLSRVAAALRAAIRSGASEEDLRRLSMVTKLSNQERRKVIEAFYAKVMEGCPIADDWVREMVDASTPDLPDDATAEQLDAWVELATMLDDPSFVKSMRSRAADFWSKDVNVAALQRVQGDLAKEAAGAIARGVDPTSKDAVAIVHELIRQTAAVVGGLDEAQSTGGLGNLARVPEELTERLFSQYDRRAERYWELVYAMRGEAQPAGHFASWRWLGAAIRHHLVA